jgi:DNA repair exonuclease SbcCD ATPase subunit
MIPVRVRLAGFLSYREPQELHFDSAKLWLLTGPNGSGKSALFDAIAWALFGQHRGGSGSAGDLIHKDSSRCDVELDFHLGEHLFRIDRSLRRTRGGTAGTQGIYRYAGREWRPEPETTRKAEFDEWIAKHLGLTFDAFTASTLLQQGHAEKLLDATPKGRAEVLASVMRLERYQRLHERANQEKLKQKAIVEAIDAQSQGVATVSDDEIETAARQLGAAESAVEAARTNVAKLERAVDVSHRTKRLTTRLAEARGKLAGAEAMLAESAKIEKDYARFQELTAILPVAESVLVTRGKRSESEHRTQRYHKQQDIARQQKDQHDRDLAVTKATRQELAKALVAEEAKLTDLGQQLRTLSATLQTVKLIEEQAEEWRRLETELKSFPRDLTEQLSQARSETDRLTLLGQQLPLLGRVLQERGDHREAVDRHRTVRGECERIRGEGEAARQEHEAIRARLAELASQCTSLDGAFAEAEVQLRHTRTACDHLENMRGESTCGFCGQPLTEEHLREELQRRVEDLHRAERTFGEIAPCRENTKSLLAELQTAEAESNERLLQLRGEYKEQSTALAAATRDADRYDRAIAETIAALSSQFQSRISNEFPNREALNELTIQAAELDESRRILRQLQEQTAAHAALKQQLASAQAMSNRLRKQLPPGDGALVREEHQTKQAEESSLASAVRAGKRALDTADREIEKQSRGGHEWLAEFTDLTGRLRTEEATREHCDEILEREMRKLPPEWQMRLEAAGLADFATWKDSHQQLISNRTQENFRQLDAARANLENLRDDVRKLAAELPRDFETPEEVSTRLAEARTALQLTESAAANARALCQQHDRQRALRVHFDERRRDTVREFSRWKRLADLLGRDGLQRHLLHGAEREIVAKANAVLVQLFDGPFTLHLAGDGEAEKALELKAIHATLSETPIDVAFLSGSQKFRVAVALALGLGEFAGRQPMQSLMIDEGFGSLDADNRVSMIRELHMLSQRLARILVVSHDADFAAAFENAYRFELVNGATRVTQ